MKVGLFGRLEGMSSLRNFFAKLAVVATASFGLAVTGLAVPVPTTGGDANWYEDTDGSWRSGDIGDSQTSWIEVEVTGPCGVSFKWKTSSESNCDWLAVSVDGEEKSRISGISDDWRNCTFAVAEIGAHTLRWTYSKDDSVSDGDDC